MILEFLADAAKFAGMCAMTAALYVVCVGFTPVN